MKKTLLLLLSACLFYGAQAQVGTINHLDEKNGFAGVLLGDTINHLTLQTISGASYIEPDKYGMATYRITDQQALTLADDLAFRDMKVNYFNGRAESIHLHFYSADLSKMLDVLKLAYGNPTSMRELRGGIEYQWTGQNDILQLIALPNSHIVSIFNKDLYTKMENRKKEVLKEASAKL